MRTPSLRFALLVGLGFGLSGCSEPTVDAAEEVRFSFVDVAADAGIDVVNVSGDTRRWYIPEGNGTGAAWLDHDGDGDYDLFVGNGAGMEYVDDGRRLEVVHEASSRLYRNDGALEFTDVTDAAGARRSEWINGIATGDVDSDGDPELYLANFGEDVFLTNDGGRFSEATEAAGLGNELWGAAAVFGDPDRDGDLDLYVANYVLFDVENPPLEGKRAVIDGVEIGWGPEGENKQGVNLGAPDRYWRGDGKGRFAEATRAAGFELDKALCSYAAVFSDVDADGWPDLLVANDVQPSNLFRNQGDGTFREEGVERGFAFNVEGRPTSAMGLAVEDVDGDGDFDVLKTNFDLEANCLHLNDGEGGFADIAERCGLAGTSMDRLGWAAGLFDADLDGDLDALVANGHVIPQAAEIGMSPWLQQSQLFESRLADDGELGWIDATDRSGPGLAPSRSARGIAFGDPDDDGDVDALIVDLDAAPRLLENRSVRAGHWVGVRLVGRESNRDGLGARVTVAAGGKEWVREARTTQGLYSSHDPRRHFGLGQVEGIDRITVDWPSGHRQVIEGPALDQYHVIEEDIEKGGSR